MPMTCPHITATRNHPVHDRLHECALISVLANCRYRVSEANVCGTCPQADSGIVTRIANRLLSRAVVLRGDDSAAAELKDRIGADAFGDLLVKGVEIGLPVDAALALAQKHVPELMITLTERIQDARIRTETALGSLHGTNHSRKDAERAGTQPIAVSGPNGAKQRKDLRGCAPCKAKMLAAMKAAAAKLSLNARSAIPPTGPTVALADPPSAETVRAPSLPAVPAVARAGRVVVLRRIGYEKTFTAQLLKDLSAGGWDVEEIGLQGTYDPLMTRLKAGPKPDVLLRWEEHGCLFVTSGFKPVLNYCYQNGIAPLSIDLGYFDHYGTLMIDRYRQDGASAIRDDWEGLPESVDWGQAPQYVRDYRQKLMGLWTEAEQAGPLDGLTPGYVLVFLQFSPALARRPFAAKTMEEWAKRAASELQKAGQRVVFKASPVGPFPDIPGVPCYRSGGWAETNQQQNVRLMRHAAWSLILCSSVSNELIVLDLPVTATGRSWFTGLGVFSEPADWSQIGTAPTVDPKARAKWIHWWLQRQFEPKHVAAALGRALERFHAVPYDYAGLYDGVYKLHPFYSNEAARSTLILDAVRGLADVHSVLDAGCGAGHIVKRLGKLGYEAWGIDVAESPKPVLPKDRFVRGNVLSLPFPSGSFDCVTCMDTIEHLRPQDLDRAFAEIRRVARRWVVFSFGACPSGTKPPAGWPALHQTVRSFPEWIETVKTQGFLVLDTKFQHSVENCVVCSVGSTSGVPK